MKDRAGGVDDAPVAGLTVGNNAHIEPRDNCVFAQIDGLAVALSNLPANLIEHGAALFYDIFPIVARQQCFAARMFEQTIDGWKLAQKSGGLVSHGENQIYTGKKQIQHDFLVEKLNRLPYLTSANGFHTVLRSINIRETTEMDPTTGNRIDEA